MIFGGELVIFLSESGCPGFEDLWLTPRFAIRMLLDNFWWGVGDFICLNQDVQDLRIYGLRHASLSGCCWMIFGGNLGIFQDVFE
jgi:hypothetical protein